MSRLDPYPIPLEALDDRLGWIGTSGSGKTYNAGSGVERLLLSGARVVIVDPLGVWFGLRLTAAGQPSKHNVVIFGGDHGDLPLNEQAGALIGETVASMTESCIVDLSRLTTKSSERRFMLAFLDALYRSTDPRLHDPYHVVFDEADLWAPQKSSEPMLQSRMEEIVRRGRIRGFIPWLITQRPAVLSKDVLSQVDGLVAFKLTSSQDRDAIGAWIEGQADRAQGKEILAKLPTMQRGEGVVWVPGRGILTTAAFPPKETFDSSRTPKRGERRQQRDLKPLNLAALKDKLSTIEEEAKANDPKALKAELARLSRELAKAQRAKAPAPPPVPVLAAPDAAALRQSFDEGRAQGLIDGVQLVRDAIDKLNPRVSHLPQAPPRSKKPPAPAPVVERIAEHPVTPADGLTQPQQRILNALAWWKAFGIEQPTNEQVGFVAGYAPGSGNFNNLKGQLRTMRLIDYPAGGKIFLTENGQDLADAPTVETTVEAFHSHVRAKLSAPQLRLLDPVLAAYPQSMSTEAVAEAADYASGSGNFNNLRGQLKTIGLITYPSRGEIKAADWLFP